MDRSYTSDFALYNTPIVILALMIMIPQSIIYFVLPLMYINPKLRSDSLNCCCTSDRKTSCVRFLTKCAHQIVRKVFEKAFKPGSNDSKEDPKTVFIVIKLQTMLFMFLP